MRLPRGIVQQPFLDALRVTLLLCDSPSYHLKVLRSYSWMLWHISPALISYKMKGLGDFPAGLCIHLNCVTWNCGSYIKKAWAKNNEMPLGPQMSWCRLKEGFSTPVWWRIKTLLQHLPAENIHDKCHSLYDHTNRAGTSTQIFKIRTFSGAAYAAV